MCLEEIHCHVKLAIRPPQRHVQPGLVNFGLGPVSIIGKANGSEENRNCMLTNSKHS